MNFYSHKWCLAFLCTERQSPVRYPYSSLKCLVFRAAIEHSKYYPDTTTHQRMCKQPAWAQLEMDGSQLGGISPHRTLNKIMAQRRDLELSNYTRKS
jgi:hypothetical protein